MLYFYLRSSFAKVILLLLLTGGVELGIFGWRLGNAQIDEDGYFPSLENLLQNKLTLLVAAAAFAGVLVLVTMPGWRRGSRTDYTLNRLSVSRRSVYLWHMCYAIGCLFLLWGVQVALVLGCYLLYAQVAPASAVTNQTLLLACYRNSFCNGLLPLGEVIGFLRNVLMCLWLGTMAAATCLSSRKEKKGANGECIALLAVSFSCGVCFCREPGDWLNEMILIVGMLVLSIACVYKDLIKKEGADHEEA